jgi:hypothetical protein
MQSARRPIVTDDVHFYPRENDPAVLQIRGMGNMQPLAGAVCYVWPDGRVNLRVWDHHCKEHVKTNVLMVGAEDLTPTGEYCVLVGTPAPAMSLPEFPVVLPDLLGLPMRAAA